MPDELLEDVTVVTGDEPGEGIDLAGVELDEDDQHGDLLGPEPDLTEPDPGIEPEPVVEEPRSISAEQFDQERRRGDGLQHELTRVREDRRQMGDMLRGLEERMKPVEEFSTAQLEAQKVLAEQSKVPTDPAELFQYNMLKGLRDMLEPRLDKIEKSIVPLHETLEQSQAAERQTNERQQQADYLLNRAKQEDANVDSATWAIVQQAEITRAKFYASPEGGSMDPLAARARAQTERFQAYLQSYSLEHSGQIPAGLTGPLYVAQQAKMWGLAPVNGNGQAAAPVVQQSPAITHHREVQAANPITSRSGTAPTSNGSLIADVAARILRNELTGEAIPEAMDVVIEWARKRNPGISTQRVYQAVTNKIEELGQ